MEPRFPEPKMRDQFRKELRARLMQQAPSVLTPRRENAWTFLLRPAFAVGIAGLVLLAGAGTAAAGSVPGDPAFGLKKAFENLQVTLAFDDVRRVQLLAEIADRRLEDLQKVASRDDKAPTASEEFADAVTRFRAAVDAVQQAALEDKSTAVQNLVEAARDKHEAVLNEVQQMVGSEQAKDAIERAKDEEDRDTDSERQDKGKDPQKTPRPTRTPAPSRPPSPSLSPRVSGSPRGTERADGTESPRPVPTPRASATR